MPNITEFYQDRSGNVTIEKDNGTVLNYNVSDVVTVQRDGSGNITGLTADGQVVSSGGGAGITDGDKGDIVVSGAGSTFTIDNEVVSNSKLATAAQSTIKGRAAGSGTGTPVDLTPAQARTILNVADGATANTGTVTNVSMSVPTGLTVAGSPVTTSGSLDVTLTAGYSIPTTTKQTEWDNKAAASHTHTIANVTGLQAVLDGKLGADQAITPSALPDNGSGTDSLIIQRSGGVYTQTRDSLFVGKGAEVFTWAGKPTAAGNTNRVITILDSGLVGQFWSDGTYWRCLKEVSLLANGNPATTTSGTTETVLATIPLPALALADNGKVVVEFLVSYPNNANNKTLNLRLGGTGINGTSVWEQTATTTVKMAVRCGFMNRNSTASQVQTNLEYGFGFGQSTLAIRTAAVDTSVATSLFLTGLCANGADLITLQAVTVTML